MSDVILSSIVESQLPEFIREEHQLFATFIKRYYEWLEKNGNIVLEFFTGRDKLATLKEVSIARLSRLPSFGTGPFSLTLPEAIPRAGIPVPDFSSLSLLRSRLVNSIWLSRIGCFKSFTAPLDLKLPAKILPMTW